MDKRIGAMNLGNFGSTGKIACGVLNTAKAKGATVRMIYPGNALNRPKTEESIVMSTVLSRRLSEKAAYFTGRTGCYALFTTARLLRKLKRFDPQILHLHNLHDSYVNLPMLFRYIKKHDIRVVWTLHDCWAFTGHCPHFDGLGCDRWLSGCGDCPQPRCYPPTMFDNSRRMFLKKKAWFTGVKDMTIVTPSHWLAELARKSFLKEYDIRTIHNGIDLSVFKPTDTAAVRQAYAIPADKKIVLAVAFGWDERKGLDVIADLAARGDENCHYVVVGIGQATAAEKLPACVTAIACTQNQQELAALYSLADVFINPTREDNYPTVNMEALACGTPVVTFNTGGSPEIPDDTCGITVEKNDVDGMHQAILRVVADDSVFTRQACLERAKAFNMYDRFSQYIDLFER